MRLQPKYLPTPEKIRERCAVIQESWDKGEERKRRNLPRLPVPMVVPTFAVIEDTKGRFLGFEEVG